MREYVLDANAVIRYLIHGPGIERLDRLFAEERKEEARLSISVINLGEVLYTLAKRAGLEEAKKALQIVARHVHSVHATEQHATAAAGLKFTYKLGYADCFAAELAIRLGATLVTADPDFAKLGKQLKTLTLPRHKA